MCSLPSSTGSSTCIPMDCCHTYSCTLLRTSATCIQRGNSWAVARHAHKPVAAAKILLSGVVASEGEQMGGEGVIEQNNSADTWAMGMPITPAFPFGVSAVERQDPTTHQVAPSSHQSISKQVPHSHVENLPAAPRFGGNVVLAIAACTHVAHREEGEGSTLDHQL